jgi:hypothetical protein
MLYPRARLTSLSVEPQPINEHGNDPEGDQKSSAARVSARNMSSVSSMSPSMADNTGVGQFPLYFMIISSGYMFPWTAICSKINFFTEEWGSDFFCLLNIVFYASGLPVSLLASWYDAALEMKYQSKFTYLSRTILCLTFILACVVSVPWSGKKQIIIIVGFLGVFTWAVHGSHSKLAAMVQYNSNVYQQVGFVLPAFFSLFLNFTLSSPEFWTCFAYFTVIAMCVIIAMVCSIQLLRSNFMKLKFVAKDRQSLIEYHSAAICEPDTSIDIALLSTSEPFDYSLIKYHVFVLFMVIFCSVLEGSFISYVQPVSTTLKLGTVLFFVRVFADLLGRPATVLNFAEWFRSVQGIFALASIRVLLLGIFFIYIYFPNLMFRSDGFIIGLQGVISGT